MGGDGVFSAIRSSRQHRTGGGDRDVAAGELVEPADTADTSDIAATTAGVEHAADGQRAGTLAACFDGDATTDGAVHAPLRVDGRADRDVAARKQLDVATFEAAARINGARDSQGALRIQTDVTPAPLCPRATGRQRRRRVDDNVSARGQEQLTARPIGDRANRLDGGATGNREIAELRVELHVAAIAASGAVARSVAVGGEMVEHLQHGAGIRDDTATAAGIG